MYFWCILFRKVKQRSSESAGGGFPSWKRASKKSTNQENSSKSFEVPGRGLGITWCTLPHSTYPWPASIQRSGLFSSSLSNHKDGWTTPSQKQGSCHTAITSDYSGTNQTGFGQFIIKEERWIYRLGESLSFLIVLLFSAGVWSAWLYTRSISTFCNTERVSRAIIIWCAVVPAVNWNVFKSEDGGSDLL